jgi:hypothetical protein
MKEHKDQVRLERKRRLANALKANIGRRKAQHRRKEQSGCGQGTGKPEPGSQEGCPGAAIVLGTGHTGGKG